MKPTEIINKTNGKKTEATSLLMVAFQVLMIYKPDIVSPNTEHAINIMLSSGVAGALLHRLWRNRKKIATFTGNLINRISIWKKEKVS